MLFSRLGLAALAILTSFWASDSLAACATWDASGDALNFSQDNTGHVEFDLDQDGDNLSGLASYGYLLPGRSPLI